METVQKYSVAGSMNTSKVGWELFLFAHPAKPSEDEDINFISSERLKGNSNE
jgi:hypothetical protein